MFAILRDFRAFAVLEITLALVFVVQAVPTDEKDKGNTGNSNGGNNSRPISTSKSYFVGLNVTRMSVVNIYKKYVPSFMYFGFASAVNFFMKCTNQLNKKPKKWMRRMACLQ